MSHQGWRRCFKAECRDLTRIQCTMTITVGHSLLLCAESQDRTLALGDHSLVLDVTLWLRCIVH